MSAVAIHRQALRPSYLKNVMLRLGGPSLIFPQNADRKLLEQKGLALNGLGVASIGVGLGNKTLIELERPSAYHTVTTLPPHTCRPGDLAKSRKSINSHRRVRADKTMPARFRTPLKRCRVLKLANSITYDRGSPCLAMPSRGPTVHAMTFFDILISNDSQKRRLSCLRLNSYWKTHTLIEIIGQLTSITPLIILDGFWALPAPSHGPRLRVTRIGHPARVIAHEGALNATLETQADRSIRFAAALTTLNVLSGREGRKTPRGLERKKMWEEVRELRKESRRRERGVVSAVLQGSQVVLSTCHSSGGHQLHNQDVRSTQALEAVCWVPIFKAKKLILAGDPKQLPPTVLSLRGHVSLDQYSPASKVDVPTTLREWRSLSHDPTSSGADRQRKRAKAPETRQALPCNGSMLTTHSSVATHLLRQLPNVVVSSEEDAQEILGTPVYFERLEGDSDEATIVKQWVATLVCDLASVCTITLGLDHAHANQCVVGGLVHSTTRQQILKDWLIWLEENADVRYAGLD
ncbi:AAA domain-containing protein [Lactarius hengduanensis]|nr:AAA domain-containing protein [Lactarius hengduanensis]